MFLGDSKFHKLMVTISLTSVSVILTFGLVKALFFDANKPAIREILFVIIYDSIWIFGYIFYVRKK